MTVTYEEIQDWHEAGDDAATIVSKFNAQGLTVRDIDLGQLLFTMNFNGMLTKEVGNDAAKKWTGTVLSMKAAVAADDAATLSINQWLSHITNQRNSSWQTTRAEYSAPFYALYQIFNNPPNASVFNVGDLDAIYELGGGRRETTVAEVQALMDVVTRQQIAETAVNPLQAKVNAMSSWLTTPDNLQLSVADYQALADELLASPDGNPTGGE